MEPQTQPSSSPSLSIPVAIVLAGALIAGAVFFASRDSNPTTSSGTGSQIAEQRTFDVPPVSEKDHMLGNPNAEIVIVEYSDTECPFCKQFHATMHRIIEEYGKDGRVAWVYRQFPIEGLHPKAPRESEATECAAELGGNSGFWAYIDRLFEITPSNNGLDLALLPQIAEDVGLDRGAFESCLSSGRHRDAVAQAYQDAIATGADATPYSFVLVGGEVAGVFRGAYTYTDVKTAIDSLLQ